MPISRSLAAVSATALALVPVLPGRLAGQSLRPSFSCARASFPDERAICGDDRLAEMDQAAAIALAQVPKAQKKMAREDAFGRLEDRHACGTSKMCIVDNQAEVIDALRGYGAHVDVPPWIADYKMALIDRGEARLVSGLPKNVGTCTRTRISGIGTRFGEPLKPPKGDEFDAGTSVGFADDGHQVSYSFDAAVAASAIGDPVILCLVSLPRNCPPGDDRGKVYSATNLRTKGAWTMPDSQHMCGGA